jgi:hypothetical protein
MCTHIITYKRATFLNVFFSLQKWSRQKLILEQGILHFLAQERGTSANESSANDRD